MVQMCLECFHLSCGDSATCSNTQGLHRDWERWLTCKKKATSCTGNHIGTILHTFPRPLQGAYTKLQLTISVRILLVPNALINGCKRMILDVECVINTHCWGSEHTILLQVVNMCHSFISSLSARNVDMLYI